MFLDFLCSLFKKNEGAAQDNKSFIPPAHLIDGVGGGGEKMFVKVGEEFFGYFVEKGGLNPTDRILDIGCGCGRMAIPLLTYLKDPGEYWGFDIVQPAVQWAQERISPTFPKFHFHAIDVHNRLYNPKGRTPPGKFQFPYADDFFDFTFLTSVFTHMVAPEMRHYLAEIVRTLKPGGRCFTTYFVLNPESRDLMGKGKGKLSFPHLFPDCAVSNAEAPEAAVAYDEPFIRQCFSEQRLSILEPFHWGNWCGRDKFVSFQDFVIAVKQ